MKYATNLNDENFFDADKIKGLCEWRDFKTGAVLGLTDDIKGSGKDEWYEQYGWYWNEDAVNSFVQHNPEAIICGSAENVVDYFSVFDGIFILKKTEEELLGNLSDSQRINPFGKTANQRAGFMKWQTYLINEAVKFHPIIISGNTIADVYFKIKS